MSTVSQLNTAKVFDTIPSYYDRMNNAMSFGLHHRWKKQFISLALPIPPDATYVDLACGTGDIAELLLERKKSSQHWILIDPSLGMLDMAKKKLGDDLHYLCAHGESLPLESKSVHTLTMSFGLRNTFDRQRALSEMFRILEPGGQLLIMEFHTPKGICGSAFSIYQTLLPHIGSFISQDTQSYDYLVQSIQEHPPKEQIVSLLKKSGFDTIHTESLLGDLVVMYHALKGY